MEHTPKNMALQLGALIALIVSISSLLVLLFGIINLVFPDAAAASWEYSNAQEGIRYAIASLLVFFPTYLLLTRKVNVARRHESGLYHTLTKWLVYAALLVGGLVMLGDLVAVIMAFLNGELTTRFLLKAVSMFIVVGAAFEYYRRDAIGFWNTREKMSIQCGAIAAVVVIAAIVYGYYQIDAPSLVREQSIDQNQINDLQDMQWRIEEYYATQSELPSDLKSVYQNGAKVPVAPEGRAAYEYKVTGDTTYELCAEFGAPTPEYDQYSYARPVATDIRYYQNQDWEHDAGTKCFERTIILDQELKPTLID